MKYFLQNVFWSILAFIGILIVIGFLNDSYVGMKQMLADPFNWVVIAVVIAGSIAVKMYRLKNEMNIADSRNL